MESVLNSAIKDRGEFNDNLNRFVKTNKSDILDDY